MSEDEMMRKYAEAHGCWGLRLTNLTDEQLKKWKVMIEGEPLHIEMDSPVRPLPCVRDEHGEIKEQTVKQLLAKINEELDELKEVLFIFDDRRYKWFIDAANEYKKVIAEEAADTITAITTMLEALGIDAAMRDEAQRRVNERNRERGRL